MFDRRARQAAAEAERRRRRPRRRETTTLRSGVRVSDAGDDPDEHEQAGDRRQALTSGLAPIPPRVDLDVRAHRPRRLRNACFGLRDEPTDRATASVPARTAQGVRSEPLGPPVQRRVGRRRIAEHRPNDLTQAAVAARVPRDRMLDDGKAVDLAGQHVARENADPGLAPWAPRDGDVDRQADREQLVERVDLQQHETPCDRRPRQHQAGAVSPARLARRWRPPTRAARHSTSARSRGTRSDWRSAWMSPMSGAVERRRLPPLHISTPRDVYPVSPRRASVSS